MSALAKTSAPAAKQSAPKVAPKRVEKPKTSALDFTVEAETDTADVIDIFTGKTLPPFWQACENLRRAMARGQKRALPKQERLEEHFDAALGAFTAVWSAEIRSILDALGAEAAVIGDQMALRSEDVSFETLLHETAHLLQMVQGGIGQTAPDPVETAPETAHAEAEAEAEAITEAPATVQEPLGAEVVAFRQATDAEGEQTDWEAAQEFRTEARQDAEQADTPAPPAQSETKTEATAEEGTQTAPEPVDLGAETAAEPPNIESELPPLSAEAEAAKAAVEESVAALEAAITPELYMQAFSAAPPSVKAQKEPTLAADMAALAEAETAAHEETIPEFSATLDADDTAVPEVEPVGPPSGEIDPLEAETPAPAPEPDIAPTQDLGPFSGNQALENWRVPGAGQVDARTVARAISGAETSDETVETSPGEAPPVPLEGETDPQRANDQAEAAGQNAGAQRDEATQAVIDGPGPEQVQLRAMDDPVPMVMEETALAVEAQAPVDGAADFSARELDAETTAIFDAHHGPEMQASMAEADAQMATMATERDAQRDAASSKAETDMAAAEAEANAEQVSKVSEARQTIQDERQATVDGQHAAVDEMTAEAEAENQATQTKISDRVAEDEAEISRKYTEAETKAEGELSEAEAKAERKKAEAEAEAEDDSWWDAAVDFVADQLAKLGDLIGEIFDAVRSAITTILDAVKDAAFALIDAAASFIQDAIALYGELLQLAVSTLIGSVFPELAEALNEKIREGVRLAQEAVDVVAEGLKSAVAFIVDAYKNALLAVLAFVEGALNTLVAVMQAALTGDWSEVARLILEPILDALGINKDDFYAFIGNALDAITKIIDDPIQFLTYLLQAVVEGFRKFGENFVDHLIAGIIGWLTGAFAGSLTMPAQFDLMGVLDIARQILGLTLDMLRRIAVRILGEAAVERIEFFLSYASELITGGWSALFDRIKQDLSGLFDMVMGQITTFLLERVVKAGIVWLAGLINPAGALLKVVMLIWDAIMWLKDNLGRMIAIVETIVQGMIDIANGNTEPASNAVEGVLARLLTPTIDLIARFIGLGNVAGRVQEIFQNIHQTIEDAVVKLIRAVVARFTGGGGGSGTGGEDDGDAPATGDLMAPVSFSGGGESHTLYTEEHGDNVIPYMRSTPQPVETWLTGLRDDAGVRAQLVRSDPEVSAEQVSAKKTEIAPLVTRALGEEAEMDTAGDQADDARDQDPAQSRDEVALLEAKARETAQALTAILEALGLSGATVFNTVFGSQIEAVHPEFQTQLNGTINSRINGDPAKKISFSQMSWGQVPAALGADSALLTDAWKRPFHAGGALRENDAFKTAFFAKVAERAAALNAEPTVEAPSDYATNAEKQGAFWRPFLEAGATSAIHADMLDRMLGAQSRDFGSYAGALVTPIDTALRALHDGVVDDKPDYNYKENIKAASFRTGGLFETTAFASARYGYFEQQDAAGGGVEGTLAGSYDINWFLRVVPAGSSAGSKRAQKNVTYTADMIRAADPGHHEWILASQANQAIAATIAQLDDAGAAPAEGFANFVRFQHEVRTPTSQLVFSPQYTAATNPRTVGYLTPAHVAAMDRANGPLSADQLAALYPSGPTFGTPVATVQAHSGGLRVVKLDGSGTGVETHDSSASSSAWHNTLRDRVSGVLGAQGALDLADMARLGEGILAAFDDTVFSSGDSTSGLTSAGAGYGLYEFTGSGAVSTFDFATVVGIAIRRQEEARADLIRKINAVIQPMSVS
ncbi:phage tail protein [Flavimaricola marinus]|uniref:DUF4157 domain-containing protein n=1 Tax=Flavimaricola marinus TaxID=1819565 RepID=A0A238LBB8_9RHOB|nr:hypothetical protein [Flavimaricola marinus]SMY06266.1 hypothetical protein LOM8899_00389 [Flavimaricola marinus]